MTTEWPKGNPALTIENTDSGDSRCRMTLSGEFDMDGSPRFRAAVNDALGRGRHRIAVDADAVAADGGLGAGCTPSRHGRPHPPA